MYNKIIPYKTSVILVFYFHLMELTYCSFMYILVSEKSYNRIQNKLKILKTVK